MAAENGNPDGLHGAVTLRKTDRVAGDVDLGGNPIERLPTISVPVEATKAMAAATGVSKSIASILVCTGISPKKGMHPPLIVAIC